MIISQLSQAVTTNPGTLAQGDGLDIPWVRIVLMFALCISLAVAAIGFVRLRHGLPFLPDRLGASSRQFPSAKNQEDGLTVAQRLSAGPSGQFIILARGNQRYLLHVSPQGVTEIDRYLNPQTDAGE